MTYEELKHKQEKLINRYFELKKYQIPYQSKRRERVGRKIFKIDQKLSSYNAISLQSDAKEPSFHERICSGDLTVE